MQGSGLVSAVFSSIGHIIVEQLSFSLFSCPLMFLNIRNQTIAYGLIQAALRRSRGALLVALFVICNWAPSAAVAAADPVRSVGCGLHSEMKDGFLQLTAIVRSKDPVSGEYHLVVSKHSQSGSSENAQSGAFTLGGEQERVLTTTLLDRGAVGHYRAELSITTNAGRVSCSSP